MAIDRTLHKYTLGEELVSSISHATGAILALVGSIMLIIKGLGSNALIMTSIVIYGVSMISMYTVSTVYHSLKPNGGKKVMRILDHCFIYVLIIGTYAPFTLAGIGSTTGILLFLAVITLGTTGIVLTAIDMKRFSKFCFTCYLFMGWIIVLAIKPLINSIDGTGLFLLVSGGIVYTVGAVFYGLGKKVKYIHSLWHFFVLAGTALHFLSIYFSVIK